MRPAVFLEAVVFLLASTIPAPRATADAAPRGDAAREAVGAYLVSKVADDSGPIQSFNPYTMAVNAHGAVATVVMRDDLTSAVVRFDGSGMTTIASGGAFDTFSPDLLAINDSGLVAFTGDPAGAPSAVGVFAGSGGALVTLGPVGTPWPMYTLRALDNSGTALMQRHLSAAGNVVALVAGAGGPIVTVYDTSGLPEGGVIAAGDLSDGGAVAFAAGPLIGDRRYIYRGSIASSPLVVVASPALTNPDLPHFGAPAINDAGRVVFTEGLWGGLNTIYTGRDEGSLAVVTSTAGPFSSFGAGGVAINRTGTVLFQAALDGGSGTDTGIFTGPELLADRVIGAGDSLDGATVVFVETNQRSLTDSGVVLFFADLADGRQGLFLARPILLFADGFESGDASSWSANGALCRLPGAW